MRKNRGAQGLRRVLLLYDCGEHEQFLALQQNRNNEQHLLFQNRNNLDIAAATLAQTTRRAGVLARASDGDTNWGVYVEAGNLILFKGINYAGRDSSYDENYEVPLILVISGTQEYIFSKFTGYPLSAGSTTLTLNNETRTISINAKGTAIY